MRFIHLAFIFTFFISETLAIETVNCKCQDGSQQFNQYTDDCCQLQEGRYPGPNNQCIMYGAPGDEIYYFTQCCNGYGVGRFCW